MDLRTIQNESPGKFKFLQKKELKRVLHFNGFLLLLVKIRPQKEPNGITFTWSKKKLILTRFLYICNQTKLL